MSSSSATVLPRTTDLPLAINGWSITVREELTHGEHVAMLARMYRESENGRLQIEALKTGDALMVAYLVDWTLTDHRGERIEIRGLSADEVQDVLNNLRIPVAKAIKTAIEAHEQEVSARDDAQKKTESGATLSPPISLSAV